MCKLLEHMEVKNETKYGTVCRPGGFSLTERALSLCKFPEGAKLIDMGCGCGATVRFLNQRGFHALGVDADGAKANANANAPPGLSAEAEQRIFHTDAANLPFADQGADGMFFECSFSKMLDPNAVLSEARRVLKTGGTLVFADFYAKEQPQEFCGMLGRVEPLKKWRERLTDFGFSELYFEDDSDLLPEMWGQLIFDYGLAAVCAELGTEPLKLQKVKLGYFLWIAKKEGLPCIHR